MKKIILLTFSALLLLACNPSKKFAAELNDIDLLNGDLDSVMTIYKSIDFDSILYIKDKALEQENFIKKYYISDTVSLEFGNKMSYLKRIRKSLKHLDVNRPSIEKEGVALQKQLENLKTDILDGRFDRDQITIYLGEEKEAITAFKLNFESIYLNLELQKKNFYFASPTVSRYIETIKSNLNQY